jgi:hypothetical protein
MNKKFYLLLILSIASLAGRAQTQKGNQLLGGSLSLSTATGTNTEYSSVPGSKPDVFNDKMNSFSIGPSYSYFLANNLDLGASIEYSSNKQTFTLPNVATQTQDQLGMNYSVYLRKYYLFENKIGFRVGPFAGYRYSKSSAGTDNTSLGLEEAKEKFFNAGIGFDLVYFPTRKLGLAAGLGSLSYSHEVYTESDNRGVLREEKDNGFGLNLASNNLTLSVFFAFGK